MFVKFQFLFAPESTKYHVYFSSLVLFGGVYVQHLYCLITLLYLNATCLHSIIFLVIPVVYHLMFSRLYYTDITNTIMLRLS